jgi:hypothetical protein
VGVGQPRGGTGAVFEQVRESFAEDRLRAARLGAAESADDEAQREGPVAQGEIGDGAPVTAVDAVRRRAAVWAGGSRGVGDEQGDGSGRCPNEVIQAQSGAGEEIDRQHGRIQSGNGHGKSNALLL